MVRTFLATIGLVALASLMGCGGNSNLGSVSGKVTLEGQPVPDALVKFTPVKGGSPSNARTNSSGEYTLTYTDTEDGAEIGEHTVSISTYRAANPEADPPTTLVPEKVPAKYNSQTTLKADVKSGSNTIDFPLKADGPVLQPAPKDQ